MNRYHTLSVHFRNKFGHRVQKIPLDAASSCPNRDGTISTGGCVFCNPSGSGTGRGDESLTHQWNAWRERYERKFGPGKAGYLAYFQSFSNTYGPPERLAAMLDEAATLPGCMGVAVGTRPDCLDPEKIDLLAEAPFAEKWLELGLQSANDSTLERINRGHGAASFAEAARAAAEAGLGVCAHMVAGLPGEGEAEFLETISFLASLPVAGVKLHSCYVARGTPLAEWWREGRYTPLERDEYAAMAARALTLLPPEVVVQRLTGDPAPDELLAPDWAADKGKTMRAIQELLRERSLWQGKKNGAPGGPPPWFQPEAR
ncbi:TIGR01212 family radical SAM protein [Desulfohalovibrio reitneri]|uniref:TIGR01212 family radical SAM protein n=1 Tax=Desulfohalovibrio reitneri TaxID=1307759 RepID=UPI0004A6EEBB|nr:TIGR01212 family radical SAM protein [Desulfohalovibrio reitneri]